MTTRRFSLDLQAFYEAPFSQATAEDVLRRIHDALKPGEGGDRGSAGRISGDTMRAMLLDEPGTPLRLAEVATPEPAAGEILIKVEACGVCRTDLHVLDGELQHPRLPLIPGHEIVGRIVALGSAVTGRVPGERVGIPWLAHSCGTCRYCARGQENLCAQARYTGYQLDGGYAELAVADQRYVFGVPAGLSDASAAPLLCAGLHENPYSRQIPEIRHKVTKTQRKTTSISGRFSFFES